MLMLYGARPLLANVNPDDLGDDAKVAPCPKCGKQCIERPELEAKARAAQPNALITFVCTECMIRHGALKGRNTLPSFR